MDLNKSSATIMAATASVLIMLLSSLGHCDIVSLGVSGQPSILL